MKLQDLVDSINVMRSPRRLLVLSESIKRRMETLKVSTSNTDPVGHYAEWLTQKVFGGERSHSASQAGHDLIDCNGRKIQVKGRVMRKENKKRGARINEKNYGAFDYLVVVVFDFETYKITKVIGMSHDVFFDEVGRESSDFSTYSVFSDDLNKEGVDDLTKEFQKFE